MGAWLIVFLLANQALFSAGLTIGYTQPLMTIMEPTIPRETTAHQSMTIDTAAPSAPKSEARSSQSLLLKLKSNSPNGFAMEIFHHIMSAKGLVKGTMDDLEVRIDSLSEGKMIGTQLLNERGATIKFDSSSAPGAQVHINTQKTASSPNRQKDVITLMVIAR
jgi:hypothetical protein